MHKVSAKQSQLPEAGHRGGVPIADWGWTCGGTPAVRPADSDPRGLIVQNEPNWAADRQAGPWLERIMRNKPNLVGSNVPNEPNRPPDGPDRMRARRFRQVECAKRSQLARRRPGSGAVTGGQRAKQSQSALWRCRAGRPTYEEPRGNRAKQTQFLATKGPGGN
jgi:hypothetical protein